MVLHLYVFVRREAYVGTFRIGIIAENLKHARRLMRENNWPQDYINEQEFEYQVEVVNAVPGIVFGHW